MPPEHQGPAFLEKPPLELIHRHENLLDAVAVQVPQGDVGDITVLGTTLLFTQELPVTPSQQGDTPLFKLPHIRQDLPEGGEVAGNGDKGRRRPADQDPALKCRPDVLFHPLLSAVVGRVIDKVSPAGIGLRRARPEKVPYLDGERVPAVAVLAVKKDFPLRVDDADLALAVEGEVFGPGGFGEVNQTEAEDVYAPGKGAAFDGDEVPCEL